MGLNRPVEILIQFSQLSFGFSSLSLYVVSSSFCWWYPHRSALTGSWNYLLNKMIMSAAFSSFVFKQLYSVTAHENQENFRLLHQSKEG